MDQELVLHHSKHLLMKKSLLNKRVYFRFRMKRILSFIGEEDSYGEMTLYFGCKARNWDYLYKEELLKYHDDKLVENYHVAFSREQVRI